MSRHCFEHNWSQMKSVCHSSHPEGYSWFSLVKSQKGQKKWNTLGTSAQWDGLSGPKPVSHLEKPNQSKPRGGGLCLMGITGLEIPPFFFHFVSSIVSKRRCWLLNLPSPQIFLQNVSDEKEWCFFQRTPRDPTL